MQPSTISGAVANPNSSAPRIAATTTSRPVRLKTNAVSQAVEQERLLHFGQAELPRNARLLDRRQRGRAGAAGVARHDDQIGIGLRDAGRDGADAALRDELYRNRRGRIDICEIVNELLQILDRVDVVVRRRRDERHARRRAPGAGDVLVHLVPGELPTLSRLGALRDLDLQLVRVDEIFGRHAETPRRDLLDRARLLGVEADAVLAALTGVAPAAEAIHGDRERLVRFLAQRPEGHGARNEALDDLLLGFNLVERNGRRLHEVEQSAKRVARVLAVDDLAEFGEGLRVVRAGGVLQRRDRARIPVVVLALDAEVILAAGVERPRILRLDVERDGMPAQRLFGDHLDAHAANP
jgi:hypothetical protein